MENFIQEQFFTDIFPAVPATPHSTHFNRGAPSVEQVKKASQGLTSSPATPKSTRQERAELDRSLPEFRVVRSARRKRGVSAFRSNGIIEIHIPDRTSRRDEISLIPEMIALVLSREAKSRRSNEELHTLALELISKYLPEFHERPAAITWRAMQGRWGSCTTVDASIRIAERLASAPGYVLKCVIFHELIHLRIPHHGEEFHDLLSRYPDLERAEAFLEGFEAGLGAPPEEIAPQDAHFALDAPSAHDAYYSKREQSRP